MVVDIHTTDRHYDLLYSDPPWIQQKGGPRKARPHQKRELDYPTCSMDEIKQIHQTALTLCNDVHSVFVWTIDKYLFETEQMMHELGYSLHARLIWNKTNGVAPAFTVRFSHEYLLWFYRKGKMLKPCEDQRGKYTTVLTEPATRHSKKPLCAYEMIESMFPDAKKIELFARNERAGWDCWGNEVTNWRNDNG